MILQTGGVAFGAILTRSRSFSSASARAAAGRHNTKLIAISSDHAKLLVTDLLVDLMF